MRAQAMDSSPTTPLDSAEPKLLGHLIHGEWDQAEATLESTNPADPEQVVALFPAGDNAAVKQAVEAASPKKRAMPAPWRAVGSCMPRPRKFSVTGERWRC